MRRIAAALLQRARVLQAHQLDVAGAIRSTLHRLAAPGRPGRQPRHRASLPGAVPLGLLGRGNAGAARSWAALLSPLPALDRRACVRKDCPPAQRPATPSNPNRLPDRSLNLALPLALISNGRIRTYMLKSSK
jgi:hypothetical protein